MNFALKKAWIDALLSGEYKQGQGALKKLEDGDTCTELEVPEFCCLGVLCDVLVKTKPTLAYWAGSDIVVGESDDEEDEQTYRRNDELPENALKLTGLSHDTEAALIWMNDKSKLPFEEIAAFIKAHA